VIATIPVDQTENTFRIRGCHSRDFVDGDPFESGKI
jgi:hypothetical protein